MTHTRPRLLVVGAALTALIASVVVSAPEPERAPLLVVADAHHASEAGPWNQPVPTADLITAADPTLVTAAATASTPPGATVLTSLSRHVTPACTGTGTDGNRVQVLYVRDADKPSRFIKILPVLRTQVANIDDLFAVSAAKSGGGKRVRWVTDAKCVPVIKEVVLPKGTLTKGWSAFRFAMVAKGYDAKNRKYLTFGDATSICGLGDKFEDDSPDPTQNWNNGKAAMHARVDSGCWLPGQSVSGNAPAHELMHTLGAVQRTAPNASQYGHCTDTTDAMCYKDGPETVLHPTCSGQALFDCGGNDYFNLKPTPGSWLAEHWNTANSSFLTTVPALPAVPKISSDRASAPTKALSGARITLTGKTVPGAVSYQWVGPGLKGATGRSTTVAVPKVGTLTYTYKVGFSNGRAASVARKVVVSKSPAPKVTVTVPTVVKNKATFTATMNPKVTGAVTSYKWGISGECTAASPRARSTKIVCTLPSGWSGATVRFGVHVAQADGQYVNASSPAVRITR